MPAPLGCFLCSRFRKRYVNSSVDERPMVSRCVISTVNYSIMFPMKQFLRPLFKFLAAIVSVFLVISAFAAPPAGVLDATHAAVRAVMAVQGEVTLTLMQQPEILGTAVGLEAGGAPVLTIYVDRDAASVADVIRNLPREFRGVGVQVHLT